jgi:hypothetical protein
MQHLAEHTIELYVLGAREVASQVDAIRVHLLECGGCRSSEERFRAIYVDMERVHEELQSGSGGTVPAVVQRRASMEPFYDPERVLVEPIRRTIPYRLRMFSRQHPLAAASGGIVTLAAFAGVVGLALNVFSPPPSPSFVHLNPEQNLIDVYGKENTKLWSLPALALSRWEEEMTSHRTSRVEVADLNGDGTGEVITTAPLAGTKSPGALVRAFDARQKLLFEQEIGSPVEFRGARYGERMEAWPLVIVQDSAGKGAEIVVAASGGRSPTVISRLDAKGNILGEYWHFGTLSGLFAFDLDGNGRKEVIASGTNDINDVLGDPGRSQAVFMVIDPLRLVGRNESRATRGFGFPTSDAERTYIRFSRSDMEEALGISNGVRTIQRTADNLLFVKVENGSVTAAITFDYFFSNSLRLVSVKSNDVNANVHARLKREGKIRSTLDEAYLKRLGNDVEVLVSPADK